MGLSPETLRKLAAEISNVGHRWRTELDAAADAWKATEKALYNLSEGHGCVLRVDHETRRARPSTLLQEEK